MTTFTRAIVRLPGENLSAGLTRFDLGAPQLDAALTQHQAYCDALTSCRITVTTLAPDLQFPDSTFVEDTAVLTERGAILARPGAASRTDEVLGIESALAAFYPTLQRIAAPGTLDGGDICQVGEHFLIGISQRTNEDGALQLAGLLAAQAYTSSFVDIRQIDSILHLKSGIAYLGDGRMLAIDALLQHPAIAKYELIRVAPGEEYAANCVRANERVLIADGYPHLRSSLEELGYSVVALPTSEFRKLDGGLSCLSLRF
jgi:dimethylargininase